MSRNTGSRLIRLGLSALVAGVPRAASAASIWTNGDDARLSWDTSLQQTEAFRLNPEQPALLANPNSDDGDRSFKPGLISSRTDLFSELDYSTASFGARVSVAGWYDPVYLHRNADASSRSFNPVSVPAGRFPDDVRHLQGLQADVLDAFVHEKFELDKLPLTLRLGRHTLVWGESLFFGGNGIASGQAPQDIILASSLPDATAKQLFLPVTQLSGSIQLRPGLSIEFYDQFEWRHDRLPGVGSYFSTSDILDQGGERLLLGQGRSLLRTADVRPSAFGQFGLALRGTSGQTDWGLYAVEADAHSPLVVTDIAAGHYHLVYPGHTGLYGASLSTFLGDNVLAAEVSFHNRVPVGVAGGLQAAGTGPVPRADSLNAQVSLVSQPAPGRFWDSADISAEIAANAVLRASRDAAPASAAGRSTMAFELQLAPHYFHVLPGIDLTPSATLGYGLFGQSGVDPEMRQGSGTLTLGLNLDYRSLWHARLQFTHFIGAPSAQPLADRDFMSVSLLRSF